MDKLEAEYIARIAFKTGSEISKLIPIIKEIEDEELAAELISAIKNVITLITDDVLHKMYKIYPEIADEFDVIMSKFKRLP